VVFNGTGTLKDSIVDAGYVGTVISLSINSGYTKILSLGMALSVSSTYTQADGTFDAAGYNFYVNGAFSQTGGTFLSGSGAIDLNSTFSVTNTGTSFTATSGTMNVSNNFTLGSGITFTHNSGTILLDNTSAIVTCNNASFNKITITKANNYQKVTISSNCDLPLGLNPTIYANIDLSGTLSGTGTLTINSPFSSSSPNLIQSGAAFSGFTGISNSAGSGYFTVSGATLDLSSFTTASFSSFTLSSGTFTPPSSGTTMNVSSTFLVSGGTFAAGTGTITFSPVSTFTQSNGIFNSPSGTLSISNLSQTGGTFNGGSSTLDINGNFSVTNSGTSFTATSGTMTVSNNFTLGSGITFNHNSGTITIDTGNSTTITCNGASLYHVDITKTQYVKTTIDSNCDIPLGLNPTITTYIDLSGTLSGTGTLTIDSGINSSSSTSLIKDGASFSGFTGISATSRYLNVSGATLDLSSFTTVALGHFILSSGTFTPPSSGTTMNVSSTFLVSGGTFAAGTGNITFSGPNVPFTQSNGIFNSPSGTFTVSGAFSQTGGTFNGGSGAIDLDSTFSVTNTGTAFTATSGIMTVANSFTLGSGITFNHNSGTITFDGNSNVNLNSGGAILNNVNINTGSYTKTLAADMHIDGYFKITAGTFDVSGGNYNLNIGGDFTKLAGTFTQRSGTVTFDDASKVSTLTYNAPITFYNLTISTADKTVKFDNVDQTNVTGTLTVNGGNCGSLVQLLSDSNGIRYEINATSTKSVQYAAIKDSNAVAAASATYSNSVSNNTGWTITADTCNFSTNSNATGYSFQRKTWYDGAQIWKSFNANSQIEFWYSTDWGATWTQNSSATIAVNTNDFSVEADNQNAFITYSDGTYIKASKASSYPGVSFSWSAGTSIHDPVNTAFGYVSISRDTDSYVWVSWRDTWICFTAGTKISLSDGTIKNIEDIKAGDIVIGFNPDTGELMNSTVTGTTTTQAEGYYVVKTNDSQVNATKNHPFFIGNNKYKTAADLEVGDTVYTYDENTRTAMKDSIINKTWVNKETTVYNFSTDNYHNYIANTYLVHNICMGTTYYIKEAKSTSANEITGWGAATNLLQGVNTGDTDRLGTISPLASGHMYAAFVTLGNVKGCIYDADHAGGAIWDDSAGNTCVNGANKDAIGTGKSGISSNISMSSDTGNNLHLAYIDASDYVQYKKYSSGSWDASPTRLDSSAANTYLTMSVDTSNNDIYAMYIRFGTIYYNKYSGSWLGETDTGWTENASPTNLTSNYSGNGMVMAVWTSGSNSAFTINWDYIIIPEKLILLLGLAPFLPLLMRRKKAGSLLKYI
jgi:hypothetical protein